MLIVPNISYTHALPADWDAIWSRWFSPTYDGFVPAESQRGIPNWCLGPFRDVPKDHLPQFAPVTHSGISGKTHETWGEMFALTLDYDDGKTTIEGFSRKYGDLCWYLYTTSSHTPEHPRFKVLVWLDMPLPYAEVHSARHAIMEYFGVDDVSSLSNYHRAPCFREHYVAKYNAGQQYYSLGMIDPSLLKIARERSARGSWGYGWSSINAFTGLPKEVRRPDMYLASLRERAQQELSLIPRYPTGGKRRIPCFVLIKAMAETQINGAYAFSDAEIRHTILSHINDDKRHKMLDQILRQRWELSSCP